MSRTLRELAEKLGVPLDPDGRFNRETCASRGMPLTEGRLPVRSPGSGPARPCMRCRVPVERPADYTFAHPDRGRPRTGPLCDECVELALLENHEFWEGTWLPRR